MTTAVLVTGGTGQVGSALIAALASTNADALTLVAPPRDALDLERPDHIAGVLSRHRPRIVVHCGAWTAVDAAERVPARCAVVNTEATARIAEWCAAHGAALLHLSTDYVFDGRQPGPYAEDAPTSPLQVYGRTKRDAEEAICAAGTAAVIIRVAGVYDAGRHNFVTAILRRARAGEPLTVVADQVTSPTWAGSVAAHLAEMVRGAARAPEGPARWMAARGGIVHAAATGAVSWFDFARAVVAHAARRERALTATVITPTTAAAYGAPAARPASVVLGGTRLTEQFGLTRTSWEEQLDALFATAIP